MTSINDLYANTPAPVVQVSVIKNQEGGISVELNAYGKQSDFMDLCEVYEGLFETMETFS